MTATEAILQQINSILGVQGSFVCLPDGSIAARALPAQSADEQVALAAQIVSQTFRALETCGQRIAETDWVFDGGRVVLKNLRGGVLVILCARTINLPLLNLTTSAAIRKLSEELKPMHAPVKLPVAAPTAAPEPAPAAVAPTPSAPTAPLFAELETAWQQIMRAAAPTQTILREMGALAIWLSCPHARTLLATPEKKCLEFAGRAAQRDAIRRVFKSAGYQTHLSPDDYRSAPHLTFADPTRQIVAEIYLDTFALYHQLDLTPYLTPEDAPLAETALLLSRLQLIELPEARLRELAALFHDHAASARTEPGRIDLARITGLCANHWGWYKTVTMNLQRVRAFAIQAIPADDNAIVVGHEARLLRAIEDAPKSLGWQTRARLGETVRWYDVPVETPEKPDAEIRYID